MGGRKPKPDPIKHRYYNQIVRALKTNFGEKRALQMLYRLEQCTIELVVLSKHIITLTKEYEAEFLQR